eukprot:885169_1
MSFILTAIESSTTCLDLLPVLQRIPLQKIKQFVLDEYNELDTVIQNEVRLEMISLNHILPHELIQHILSFEYSSQSKPVCALWNKLSIQNDHIIRKNQILSSEIETFDADLTNAINVEVEVRENTGWEQWSKALLLEYKNNLNSDEVWNNIDDEYRKNIVKSKHKWRVDKHTTLEVIRRKIGSYYAINPHHIEIWLPQPSGSDVKWDYGWKGRGKWNAELDGIVGGRPEWKLLCPLKFEIQTYNVKDFDQMTKYDVYESNNVMHFEKRIAELAMFNFEFRTCSPVGQTYDRSGLNQMTISYCKDWCAKGVIQHVLTEVVQNPIFGYTFFANVLKYIKKYEMDPETAANANDLVILQSLKPYRFLIIDDYDLNSLRVFHMEAPYRMPAGYSQIKYTDFKVFFLAKNDPLVLSLQQPSNKTTIQQKSKALWVFFRRQSKRQHLIRCVLTKGHSLKDVILTHCVPFLKTPKPSLSVDDATAEDKQEEDAWLDCILETHKFTLKSAAANGVAAPLKKEHIENEKIFDQLDATTLCLHVWMPKNKSKYTTYHDRPLTICD